MQTLHDLSAPAKLNLFLHVIGRRADGYHLLQSAFVLIDWCDTLHLEARADGNIERIDLSIALPADDLCLRAARALQKASGTSAGVTISIDKQVPWGAGLGGGSSDAATVLIGLNRLWNLNWPRSRLAALGLTLGADVPFFIGGRNAWVEGIGEQLTPIPRPALNYVVLKPPSPIATAAIFTDPLLPRDTRPAILADFLAQPSSFGKNDLQRCAIALNSESDEIPQALRLLSDRFGDSRMSGSGSAVFAHAGQGLGADGQPVDWAQWIQSLPVGWLSRWCQGMDEHPLSGWLPV